MLPLHPLCCSVPRSTVLLGEGRGFEISQARLGPGRLHHCMRLVGLAERAMSIMKQRAHSRQTFGTMLSDNAFVQIKLAECRIDIEAARYVDHLTTVQFPSAHLCMLGTVKTDLNYSRNICGKLKQLVDIVYSRKEYCPALMKLEENCLWQFAKIQGLINFSGLYRLLVLHAADQLDKVGNKKARVAISVAKIHVPRSVCGVIDYAIQLHGGGGVSDDTPLARMWVSARSLRIADGPDDVHLSTVGRIEMHSLHRSKM